MVWLGTSEPGLRHEGQGVGRPRGASPTGANSPAAWVCHPCPICFHCTPKHASWLDMAEIENGILTRAKA